ncbi:MAG TPA: hypothetical protein VFP47_07655 [Pyrinomonadaceae bacterium]|nr:hypothetical protein [Pyrinomonadaceae bacterium]
MSPQFWLHRKADRQLVKLLPSRDGGERFLVAISKILPRFWENIAPSGIINASARIAAKAFSMSVGVLASIR